MRRPRQEAGPPCSVSPLTIRLATSCGLVRQESLLVRPPEGADIPAPEFPSRMEWLNVAFLRMDRLMGRHAMLVEFWDYARVNSVRTLPYLQAWDERYRDLGLRVIGVHSPGYSFGRDRDVVARAVES